MQKDAKTASNSSGLDEDAPVRPPGETSTEVGSGDERAAVVGNERMTTLAGAVLLVLIVVELVTVPTLRALLSVHILVGVLLTGPLAVKLGSTGYRFLRYYTGWPAFVRKGPPRLTLRVLAPLLLAMTLVVIGSGIGLLVTGPTLVGPLRVVHVLGTLIWLPMIAIHVFAYIRRVPGSLADDWSSHPAEQAPGRDRRYARVPRRRTVACLDQDERGWPGSFHRWFACRCTCAACHQTSQVGVKPNCQPPAQSLPSV